MTLHTRHDSAALRPGLIILAGVTSLALVLGTILLLPPPNIRNVAQRLIPPETLIVSELNYGDLIGMSGSTERSLTVVADFYRDRLRLGRGAIVGSGISSWSQGGLFGRVRSGVTMPYAAEGFVILVRDKDQFTAVIASRATNENRTSIEVFCKRTAVSRDAPNSPGNPAIPFGPPNARPGSSASSLFVSGAMFTAASPLADIAAYYFTNVLRTPVLSPTNGAISPAGSGMSSLPKRAGADSATFVLRPNMSQTVLIHCFRSPASTQTHVLVGCSTQ